MVKKRNKNGGSKPPPYELGSINGVGDDVLDVPLKMHKINGKIISSPTDTPESV